MEWEIKGLPSYGPIAHLVGHPKPKVNDDESTLTEKQKQHMIEMKKSGATNKAIGAYIGMGDSWVRKYFITNNNIFISRR